MGYSCPVTELPLDFAGVLFFVALIGLSLFLTYAGTVGTYRWLRRRAVQGFVAVLLALVALFTFAPVLALVFAIVYRSPTLANPGGRKARVRSARASRYFDAEGREIPPPNESQ
jgi:hypothetical protein